MSLSSAHPLPASILVVDDNMQSRLVAEARLSAAGYRVLQAESGERALEMFAREPVDLVLLDVRMPGIDGFATLDRLRRLPRGSEVAVVFLTALDDVATHERALKAGVDDFLSKPLRGTELLIRVRSLLRLSQAMTSLRTSHALVLAQRDELLRGRDLRRQLSAFVVHDLKSPLSMIMAATELVQRTLPSPGAEKLHIVQRAAQNMLRMVYNLLDIARSEDGRLVAHPTEVNVRELVDELVQGIRGTHGEWHSSIVIETRYRLDNPLAWVDGQLLRRLLENLLDNALRYSPGDAPIVVEVVRSQRELSLCVSDQGPGIPPSQRQRIFDMYVRLDDNNPVRIGHGLGLVFCRLALEAQGGRIWVESSSGEAGDHSSLARGGTARFDGAAFHAVLPLG